MSQAVEVLQTFKTELFGRPVCIDLFPNSPQQVWRLLRLHHLLGYLSAIIPDALPEIRSITDDTGFLIVEWFSYNPHFQAAVAAGWSGPVCGERTDRMRQVVLN